MLLLIALLSRIWPTVGGRRKLAALASKIRREVYGGLSREERMHYRSELFHDVQHILRAAKLHAETFKGYRGAFKGKSVVLVGAGPSVTQFKPIPGAIYIGLNRACALKEIPFDFLFAMDRKGIERYYADLASRDCVKFIGDQGCAALQIPESDIPKLGANVRRYLADSGHLDNVDSRFAVDLETEPLGNFHTVAMQAMQFALYGQPDRIYLVGIDCSLQGHFDDPGQRANEADYAYGAQFWLDGATRDWALLKEFARTYYPGVKIISVNPVGLKGLFEDCEQ